jgi:atypical dual specificity phosphatase
MGTLAQSWSIVAACAAAYAAGGCSGLSDREGPMDGFSWVIAGELAGMPRPGGQRPLEQDLDFIAGEGIDLLVSLTERPPDPSLLDDRGIALLHLPVDDFSAPRLEQLRLFVARAAEAIGRGEQVGVHCGAGKGRTGTFLAALLVSRGTDPVEAIAEIRRLRPGSIETPEQEQAVMDYYRYWLKAHRTAEGTSRR